jgi:hypothetical protein
MTRVQRRVVFCAWLTVLLTSCGRSERSGDEVPEAGEHVGVCRERCAADSDCSVVGDGLRCVDGQCQSERPAERACVDDGECLVRANDIMNPPPCNAPSDCVGWACVDFDGVPPGQCILAASPDALCDQGFTTVDITGTPVELCSFVSRCEADVCVDCRTDDDCAAPFALGGSRCSADGRCVDCVEDADCAEPGASRCYPEGFCGCAGAADCGGLACSRFGGCATCVDDSDCDYATSDGGLCIEGACGCRTVDDCTQYTPPGNLTLACE